jgi:hypothetical protein
MPVNRQTTKPRYVVCIDNTGYPAALERRKIYQVLPDPQAATHHLTRVIDESGEDYLYPASYFAPVTLSRTIVRKAFAVAAPAEAIG